MGIKIFTTNLKARRDKELKKLRKEERQNITCETEHERVKIKGVIEIVDTYVVRSEDASRA